MSLGARLKNSLASVAPDKPADEAKILFIQALILRWPPLVVLHYFVASSRSLSIVHGSLANPMPCAGVVPSVL